MIKGYCRCPKTELILRAILNIVFRFGKEGENNPNSQPHVNYIATTRNCADILTRDAHIRDLLKLDDAFKDATIVNADRLIRTILDSVNNDTEMVFLSKINRITEADVETHIQSDVKEDTDVSERPSKRQKRETENSLSV